MARKTLGDQLREEAEQQGLGPAKLAEAAGLDRRNVSRFINGSKDVNLDSADKMAEALGLRLAPMPGRKPSKR